MKGERTPIHITLMTIALAWEQRSTCARNRVGAVIALDGRHISSGYNGAPAGLNHCVHDFDQLQDIPAVVTGFTPMPSVNIRSQGCKVAIHAEANAISYSARHGVAIQGATIYTTLSPCYACSQLIIAAGLTRVIYNRLYRDEAGLNLLESAGVPTTHLGM